MPSTQLQKKPYIENVKNENNLKPTLYFLKFNKRNK